MANHNPIKRIYVGESGDYIFADWSRDLPIGETIAAAAWALYPSLGAPTIPAAGIVNSGQRSYVYLDATAAVAGKYSAVVTITTSAGRTLICDELVADVVSPRGM